MGGWRTFCSNRGNSAAKDERVSGKEEEKAIEVWVGGEKDEEMKSMIKKIRDLLPPSVHISFQGLYAPYMAWSIDSVVGLVDPYTLFSLFFSENKLEISVKNSNLYASVYDARIRSTSHPLVH